MVTKIIRYNKANDIKYITIPKEEVNMEVGDYVKLTLVKKNETKMKTTTKGDVNDIQD
jgi:hypothetical protein